jgi:hypothetical protein
LEHGARGWVGCIEKRGLAISEPLPETLRDHSSGTSLWEFSLNVARAMDRSGLVVGADAGAEGGRLEFRSGFNELLGECEYDAGTLLQRRVYAARDRAVVLIGAAAAALYDRSGERGRTRLPSESTQWAPSPSGRLLAGIDRGETGEWASHVQIADLLEDVSRTIELPTPSPNAMAWSPSGRRLALVAHGRLTFVEPA